MDSILKRCLKIPAGLALSAVLLAGVPAACVSAAEYTVTEAAEVMFTNESTAIYTDADENTVIVPFTGAGLPIQVTGITSNGYFRIDLGGQAFYIPAAGLTAVTVELTQAQTTGIYDAMIAQKSVYPEGMKWNNDNYYRWKGGLYSGGYGCAGFAFAVSDAAFGDAPAKMHNDMSRIMAGDILRMDHDTHSVIVLEVREDSVVVAEGNYNNSIHWGRVIPMSVVNASTDYIITRY